MTDDEKIVQYVKSIRAGTAVIRMVLAANPSKDGIFHMMEAGLQSMLKAVFKDSEEDRVQVATAQYYVVLAILDVLKNNPMYGSHALVMQYDNAVENRFKEYEQKLLEINRRQVNANQSS